MFFDGMVDVLSIVALGISKIQLQVIVTFLDEHRWGVTGDSIRFFERQFKIGENFPY